MTLFYILVFLFVIGILILVHEFGHFVSAKLLGIQVEEFALGFKPTLFSFKKGETRYLIGAIPFGGFVKLLGEEGEDFLLHIERPEERALAKKKAFFNQSPWKKMIIVSAGVICNIAFAWLLLTVWLLGANFLPEKSFVLVTNVLSASPAEKAGLKAGDILLSVDGEKITSVENLKKLTKEREGKEIELSFRRFGKEKIEKIQLTFGEAPLGVAIEETQIAEKIPVLYAPWYAFIAILKIIAVTLMFLWNFIKTLFISGVTTEVSSQVSGPIGIYGLLSQMVSLGFWYVLRFLGILSLSLGIFNFLPFPALDGGRLLFITLEGLFGRRIFRKQIEAFIHAFGFAFLILLLILVTVKDIKNLLGG